MDIKIALVFMQVFFLSGVSTNTKADVYCSNQVLAQPTAGGYSWTLASRAGQLLIEAEKRFGRRDEAWTLLGVEFTSVGNPSIWYPFSDDGQKFVIIQLTKSAANDEKRALFQLAHEVMHTLSPAGGDVETNVFEEGLATYFSIDFLRNNGFEITPDYIGVGKYSKAYDAIDALYQGVGKDKIDNIVQLIRTKHDDFASLTKDDLLGYFPHISNDLATTLASRF